MTIFKSRQVNLDPEPWVDAETGERLDVGDTLTAIFERRETTCDPRPEFEPTRDEYPWLNPTTNYRHRSAWLAGKNVAVWAPRREQFDTPVNLVLQEVRLDVQINEVSVEKAVVDALQWVRLYAQPGPFEGSGEVVGEVTAEMIEHARRVLTRLANWGAS